MNHIMNHTFNEAETVNGHSKHVEMNADEEEVYAYEVVETISNYLLARTTLRPKIGIICGSGIGGLADSLTDRQCFPYEAIPQFPVSTVKGHEGQLVFGLLEGVPVMCMKGRFHYYEGYPISKCSMPVRVMKLLGVSHLIATNAAGGLKENYKVGDMMLIKDHVNFLGLAGNNPLRGANDERFGTRFPPMSKAYDSDLRDAAMKIARKIGIERHVHEGVYACVGGPNFETIAELNMLRLLGINAIGMSTVHEVITARHCNMTVFAFSLITNECILDYDNKNQANHEEVIQSGKEKCQVLKQFVSHMVKHIAENKN